MSTNRINADYVRDALKRAQAMTTEHESRAGARLSAAKADRKEFTDLLAEFADNGVPKPVMKRLVQQWKLMRKIDALDDGLEADVDEILADARKAVGFETTPLGAAAASEDEDDPRPRFMRNASDEPKPKRSRKKAEPAPATDGGIDDLDDLGA